MLPPPGWRSPPCARAPRAPRGPEVGPPSKRLACARGRRCSPQVRTTSPHLRIFKDGSSFDDVHFDAAILAIAEVMNPSCCSPAMRQRSIARGLVRICIFQFLDGISANGTSVRKNQFSKERITDLLEGPQSLSDSPQVLVAAATAMFLQNEYSHCRQTAVCTPQSIVPSV